MILKVWRGYSRAKNRSRHTPLSIGDRQERNRDTNCGDGTLGQGGFAKLMPHVRALSAYLQRAVPSRPFRTGRGSALDGTLEYRAHPASSSCPPGQERTKAQLCPAPSGADSFLGQRRIHRIQDDQRDVRDCCGEVRVLGRHETSPLLDPRGRVL